MAHGDDLKTKPLVETIFELRWKLEGTPPGPLVDPNYKLLVGSLYGAVRESYPFHEQLPAATVPDELVPYVIQHRFRQNEDGYPLAQVGPGIFAINETADYSWATYQPRVLAGVAALRRAYAAGVPQGDLTPTQASLRYIDAIPFNASEEDVMGYLRDKLKIRIDYPDALFADDTADPRPQSFVLQSTHRLKAPAGAGFLKISTGELNGQPSLFWETQVQSGEDEVPSLDGLDAWLENAHTICRAWFFALIEGELEVEFNA